MMVFLKYYTYRKLILPRVQPAQYLIYTKMCESLKTSVFLPECDYIFSPAKEHNVNILHF